MTPHELDRLLALEEPAWRPSMTFLADLADRLDAVDAELEAENGRIPTDNARSESSVLFSLAALEAPPPLPRPPTTEPSGLLRLAVAPPPALDSGPFPVATPARVQRPAPRIATWVAAALLAATVALIARPSPQPEADLPIDGAVTSPAAIARAQAAALADPARADRDELAAATTRTADADAAAPIFALRDCFGAAGLPAGVSVRVARHARGGVTVELTPRDAANREVRACLDRAAAALADAARPAGLLELTLAGPPAP